MLPCWLYKVVDPKIMINKFPKKLAEEFCKIKELSQTFLYLDYGWQASQEAAAASLKRLDTDYLDLVTNVSELLTQITLNTFVKYKL